jgi:ketosteroid isomerase-like protein
MYRYLFVLFILLCSQPLFAQTHAARDEAQIRAARKESNKAIADHNAEGLVQYLLPNYSIVTGRAGHASGRDSMVVFWKRTFAEMPDVVYVRTPGEVIISKNDSLAWESGKWQALHSYSKGGNYSAMWRKVDGIWKIEAELFVSLE